MRGGGYYQYLSNTGYSNGLTMANPGHYFRGSETAMANPTPWARTMTGGRCGCKSRSRRRPKIVWRRKSRARRRK